jgi:hypothetical protein
VPGPWNMSTPHQTADEKGNEMVAKRALRRQRADEAKEYRRRNKARTSAELIKDRDRLRPNGTKKCTCSEEPLPLDRFYSDSANADTLQSQCKECVSKRISKATAQRCKKRKGRTAAEIHDERTKLHACGTKLCGGECKTSKPFSEFHANASAPDGLARICRDCQARLSAIRQGNNASRTDDQIRAAQIRIFGENLEIATKHCPGCNSDPKISEFAVSRCVGDGLASYCKTCMRERIQRWVMEAHAIRLSHKLKFKCENCGESNPFCLDLAHFNREQKLRSETTGQPIRPSAINSKTKLAAELEIMRPLCANCHQLETVAETGHRHAGTIQKRQAMINREKDRLQQCADCEEPVNGRHQMFDFDHLVSETKVACVSEMVRDCVTYNEEQIVAEMGKCELCCKNCHRIRTYRRRVEEGEVRDLLGPLFDPEFLKICMLGPTNRKPSRLAIPPSKRLKIESQ